MKPQVLVLGPGGIRGCMEVGGLLVLERRGILSEVEKVVGVSIGSAIALLWILGYTPHQILGFFSEVDIKDCLAEITLGAIREGKGLVPVTFLRESLKRKVLEKIGYIPVLSQIYSLTKKHFVAVATEEESEEPAFLDEENFPDLSVVDAVILSMNIPLFFHQVQYKGKIYTDGASTAPYPVDIYGNVPLLGMFIFTDVQQGTTSGRIRKVLQTSVNCLARRSLRGASENCKHLILHTKYSDTIGISSTVEDRIALFRDGFDQVLALIQDMYPE